MEIIPAIDLMNGAMVRLVRGDFAQVTRYPIDPVEHARRLRGQVSWLHVIDLDGAREGRLIQVPLIRDICDAFGGCVQVGGGVRSEADVAALRAAGATRVIVGTMAARDPALVRRLAAAHPSALVIALDTRSGHVAIDGWQTTTSLQPAAVLADLMDAPLGALIHTDIARDGTLTGPEIASLDALCRISPWLVVAAGGIATLDDVRALAAIPRLHGAIVGRALLEGTLTLPPRDIPTGISR